jgi:hypothetical protein
MDGNMHHAQLKRHTLWNFDIFEPKLFVDDGTSATTLDSVLKTRVFWTALTALTEPGIH